MRPKSEKTPPKGHASVRAVATNREYFTGAQGGRLASFHVIRELLELPTVDALIKGDYGQPITLTKWDTSQIEKEMDDYVDNVRGGLIKLMIVPPQHKASEMHGSVLDSMSDSPSPEEFNVNVASLLSATTFFKCEFCPVLWRYPALLTHTHRDMEGVRRRASAEHRGPPSLWAHAIQSGL